ncbi:Mov34-domain-containing protein [Mycena vulgaris]|nr:Mov34-domain-containing protein [Mycena vulgaris]
MFSHQRTQGDAPGAWGSSLPTAAPCFATFSLDGVPHLTPRALRQCPAPAPARRARADAERAERDSSPDPRLRTVVLPANSARNSETCGLFQGRESRFVVETLLIPKQYATSDTCTMGEEEGVLMFTEERAPLTIGWIHTHPTHFQDMLPESFVVVCAPKSDPNFAIFRLSDPPGRQTVLNCTAKQAFHPHPDVPMYTDADRGHVQMRDVELEIVDLR